MKRIHITRTLHLLTVALCIFFPDKGNADNPIIIKQPQIVPVSPEAEAVRKYVSYPVDYCKIGRAHV